jgi:hypothetical protein
MKRTERFVSILCLIASLIVLPCIFVAHPVLAGVVDGTITAYGWIAEEEYSGLSKGPGQSRSPPEILLRLRATIPLILCQAETLLKRPGTL